MCVLGCPSLRRRRKGESYLVKVVLLNILVNQCSTVLENDRFIVFKKKKKIMLLVTNTQWYSVKLLVTFLVYVYFKVLLSSKAFWEKVCSSLKIAFYQHSSSSLYCTYWEIWKEHVEMGALKKLRKITYMKMSYICLKDVFNYINFIKIIHSHAYCNKILKWLLKQDFLSF